MKKNKNLFRAWVWAYVVLIFCGTIPALLSIKGSVPMAVIFFILAVIDLGLLIAAEVLYVKKRSLFPWFGISAMGLLAALIGYGLIREIIFTAQGQAATYPWLLGSIGALFMIYALYQAISVSKKIIRGEKIIEGKQ